MANSTLQEWLNRNAYRAFPLEEDSDLSCEGGGSLPKSVVLDARFFMDAVDAVNEVRLLGASVSGDGTVGLSLDIGGSEASVVSRGMAVLSGQRVSARIVTGSPESLSGLAGEYRLSTPARFLRSRVLCVPRGIGADTLTCGGVTGTGEIRVADGVNTSLDIRQNNLVLTIRKGLGLGVRCPELPDVAKCDGNVLYFINGQKADSNGNIQIFGGEGVAVSTGTYRGIPAVIVSTSPSINRFIYK